jgi:hypothetical protein
MKNKILPIILVIVIILLIFKGCEIAKDRDNLLTQISTYKLGEKEFKNKILKDSSTMATQNQTMLTQEEALKLGLLKMEGEIRKVQSQVSERQDVVVTKVNVPYIPNGFVDTSGWYAKLQNGDNTPSNIDSLLAHSVLVPQPFKKEEKWYQIYGNVEKDGLLIDSLKLNNESSVTIGFKRSGFLGLKKQPIVEIKNTNPYLRVSKMNNVIIKKDKSIFQSKFFWLGLGVIGAKIIK